MKYEIIIINKKTIDGNSRFTYSGTPEKKIKKEKGKLNKLTSPKIPRFSSTLIKTVKMTLKKGKFVPILIN